MNATEALDGEDTVSYSIFQALMNSPQDFI